MKRITTKTIIFWSYFLATFILKKLFSSPLLKLSLFDLIFWLAGALAGAHFLKIDQLFYIFFSNPEDQLCLQAKWLIKEKKFAQCWDLLSSKVEEQKLASRSILFQLAWVILAFFTLTSTLGVFGKTLVMAIGLHLLLDQWEDVLEGQNLDWLFWQLKKKLTLKKQKCFLWLMTGLFSFLTLLLI